jgi:hypothetical protein
MHQDAPRCTKMHQEIKQKDTESIPLQLFALATQPVRKHLKTRLLLLKRYLLLQSCKNKSGAVVIE